MKVDCRSGFETIGAAGSAPSPRPLGIYWTSMGWVIPLPSFPNPPSPENPIACMMGVALGYMETSDGADVEASSANAAVPC